MKRVFYGIFSLFLIAVLAVAISRPQNNLIPSRLFLYMLVWVVILCGMKAVLSFVEKALVKKGRNVEKISRAGLIFYTVFYGIGIYIVSLILRSYPVTDYGYVYHTAHDLATGQAVEDWNYFSMWTNNLGPLTILTFCMRLGVLLGFSDPYYFVLGLNVLQLAAVLVCLYYLAGKIGEKKVSRQWLAVGIFTLWTPVWACSNAFYSDQLSFGGSIIAVALLLYACDLRRGQSRNQKKEFVRSLGPWAIALLAGILWGVSVTAKATSAIAAVALTITLLLEWRKNTLFHGRLFWKSMLSFVPALVLTVGALAAAAGNYPSKADEYRLKTPTEYWIAMGMIGDGTYADNAKLVRECNFSPNVDARKAVCREFIRENWKNMFQAEHLADKAAVIFASGDISPTSHIYPNEESLLWHWVYWEGDYYWKYACLSTGFFYAVLLLMLAGTLIRTVTAGKEENSLVFLIYLTVFGLFLFLMLWEAQNKQLYNHIPWMTLAVVCGLEKLGELMGGICPGKIANRRM